MRELTAYIIKQQSCAVAVADVGSMNVRLEQYQGFEVEIFVTWTREHVDSILRQSSKPKVND